VPADGRAAGRELAFLNGEVDAEQRLEVAVEGRQLLGAQQAHDAGMPM
jgi:hypothetical protein